MAIRRGKHNLKRKGPGWRCSDWRSFGRDRKSMCRNFSRGWTISLAAWGPWKEAQKEASAGSAREKYKPNSNRCAQLRALLLTTWGTQLAQLVLPRLHQRFLSHSFKQH